MNSRDRPSLISSSVVPLGERYHAKVILVVVFSQTQRKVVIGVAIEASREEALERAEASAWAQAEYALSRRNGQHA